MSYIVTYPKGKAHWTQRVPMCLFIYESKEDSMSNNYHTTDFHRFATLKPIPAAVAALLL